MGNKISRKEVLVVVILFLFSFLGKLYPALNGNFSFSWDFSRDMLWVRQLTIQHKPMLVGAWGSLDGTYFGPAYFYLLSIPMSITEDPRAAVIMVGFLLSFLVPLVYVFTRYHFGKKVAMIAAILFATNAHLYWLSNYSFSQQIIPLAYFLFFVCTWKFFQKQSYLHALFMGLTAGLLFSFEPVDAAIGCVLSFVFVGIFTIQTKNWKRGIVFASLVFFGILILLSPNILFDLKHDFPQVRGFIQYFSGKDQSLLGYLPIGDRILDRAVQFWNVLGIVTLLRGGSIVLVLFIVSICIWRVASKQRFQIAEHERQMLIHLGIHFCGMMLFFLWFSRLLKDYYLYLFVPVVLMLWIVLFSFLLRQSKKIQIVTILFFCILILCNLRYGMLSYAQEVGGEQRYALQLRVVDEIYAQSQGKPLVVYVYSPLIYDYPYQYLFSWYGWKKYGYIPQEYAYAMQQPEYVLQKAFFDEGKAKQLVSESVLYFLIVEKGDHEWYSKEKWFSAFSNKQIDLIQTIDSQIEIYSMKEKEE